MSTSTGGDPQTGRTKPLRRSLEERLAAGENILCAEGYVLALTRMGYVAPGIWIPEFLVERPEVLRSLHYQFIDAGSDVTEAYQYYLTGSHLKQLGRESEVERYNRIALKIAREVAEETGTLFAGGLSNLCFFFDDKTIDDPEAQIRSIHEQQARWAKEEGVDYIIAESMSYFAEAKIALEVIKSFDLPAVITLIAIGRNKDGVLSTVDGVPIASACKQLLDLGATLVGSNCYRGPATMIDVIEDIVKVVPPEKVCALPLGYRTTKEQPTWQDFKDESCPENNPPYSNSLNPFFVSEIEIIKFTKHCQELGLKYMGICCGNTGSMTRVMATTLGKKPFQSKYHDLETINRVTTYRNKMREERVTELTK